MLKKGLAKCFKNLSVYCSLNQTPLQAALYRGHVVKVAVTMLFLT